MLRGESPAKGLGKASIKSEDRIQLMAQLAYQVPPSDNVKNDTIEKLGYGPSD